MLTYKDTGVNIEAGNMLVRKLKKFLPAIGDFSGLFPIDKKKYKSPVLVASTDGVGTKLKIAQLCNKHDTVGIDLVAMSVNDIITCGAKPLFFLDYFATGKLDVKQAQEVIKGIHKGCIQSDCALIGGETAEMPGFYRRGEYDLAGFCVGIVERSEIINNKKIKKGDSVIGLASSGIHSNGYSFVRRVFSGRELKSLSRTLLTPTRIYVREILSLGPLRKGVKSICHITGGGFYDNISRVLPKGCYARIRKDSWQVPSIFRLMQKKGKVTDREMYRTFNMGIGMVLIVSPDSRRRIMSVLKGSREIGEIMAGKTGVSVV